MMKFWLSRAMRPTALRWNTTLRWQRWKAGESAAGIERMRKITLEYPETAHAYLALQTLDQYGIALPDSERAFISYQLGDYASALAALEEETAGKPITPEQYLMMGRSQRGLDDYAAAQS